MYDINSNRDRIAVTYQQLAHKSYIEMTIYQNAMLCDDTGDDEFYARGYEHYARKSRECYATARMLMEIE